jgi:hypothetical protein
VAYIGYRGRGIVTRFSESVQLMTAAVAAFDIVLVVGTFLRWRYVVPGRGISAAHRLRGRVPRRVRVVAVG